MALHTINFITWNVNGLKRHRDQKFQELQNSDVIFFQETHIGVGDENIIEDYKDKWHIFYTKYTTFSKGSAILVRKTLDFKYISDEKDNSGAYVVLKCKLEGQLYTLVSVYNHHTDTKTLDKLSRYLQSMTTGLLVIGGDFNTVLNRFIDKKWNTLTINSTHSKLLLFVENFMKSLQLVDVWRRKNPIKQDYTFCIKDCPSSRLDYFFVPEECMWCVRSCEIRDLEINENKDHRPVSLEINISVMPIQNVPQIQTIFQWLNLKKDLLTDEMGSSMGEESSNAVSEVDIVSAVHSLQVSDTSRPDGIPVSFYKDKIQDLIPYIKMLYDRIHRGGFNCSETYFNETVKSPHDDNQHFFNVDFLIIATILARHLDDVIESLPKGRIPKESATVLITPKTHYALISLSHIKDELEQQKRSNPTLSQDLLIIENLLSDAKEHFSVEKYKLLHQGCPLTPGLITLALKSYASQLFGHLEKSGVFIFKQSVIVCFQPEDLEMVKATVENNTNEVYEMEILSRGNGELLQLNSLGHDCKDEDWEKWDTDIFGNNDEESEENCSEADEKDDGSKVYEEIEFESKIYEEDESMEVDESRSAISGPPKEEMEAFHGMKKNTPPLLPVPSQSSSSSDGLSIHATMTSQGTKRKRESIIESPLTTDMIMENVRQIMKRFTKNSDQIDKGNRKKATIGISGTSGEGKSSLLSAILGKKDLLPSGCFGACTAVVTQVEANLTDSNYITEIELFSKEEWDKELKDLFSVLSDESEDRDDELYEIAVEKINAVYGNDADEKTLEELKNDAKFAKIESFLSTNKEKSNSFSKSDVSEFAKYVASYIQHSESSSGGWYWPLVKSVKIKIPDCRELLEHIVLVDIPGSGDCNKIRDDLWKSKLRECSSVWIISAINRAITDSAPWGILKHCTEELGPGGECKSINFICTKTDDIDPENYVRCAQLPTDQIPEDKDQKKVNILDRNENAKMKVKKKFKKSKLKKIFSTDDQFQVFTVSSKAFFDPSLNLESCETEIPKLQDELRTLNKSMNRELVRDYVNEAKGTLLLIQSGQLDVDKKMMEMKVVELEENLKMSLNELGKYFDSIYSDLEQCLSKGVDESEKSCVASTKKLIAPNKDGRGFHKTLGALCKNDGCYSSKNRNTVLDLNKTLAKHLHECIDEDFSKIFPVTETTGMSVQEQINKFSIIQSDSANPSSPMQHFEDFIKTEETKLTTLLSGDIVDMKKLIYSSIQITIQNKMASCYEEAAAVTGTGSMKRRQDLLITTVDEIKHDMFNKAKMKVLKKLNNLKLHIMDALEKKLKKAIERSQSQTSKIIREDVSGYIEQLERLSDQLSD
ncbi:nuclear GTPase SLIP-GC-like isoform X3 [Ctenopharyngodon idella]|uniref:nuclear GTPase SLIP-GC-like isoform X3 n=1 Tax=Ctenopharyngodon idella TaxID=7959 RepID=UPI00222EAA95|nr:nuclear GTPase SLIP-GC-like isoform X3 [Ctenopharyngodon idella]